MMSMMSTMVRVSIVVALSAAGATMAAADTGAIKRFVRFPVDTFDLAGTLSDTVLEASTTPEAGSIAVDGWWPDKKLLLIAFGDESYYVHFRAVEMNDQPTWDKRMAASGGLVCLGKRMTGSAPGRQAASKGFSSPC